MNDKELSESSGQTGFTASYLGDYKSDIGIKLGDNGGVLNLDQKITGNPALKIDFSGDEMIITPVITNASVESAIQLGGDFSMQAKNNDTSAENAGNYSSGFIDANKDNLIGVSKISNLSVLPGSYIKIKAH